MEVQEIISFVIVAVIFSSPEKNHLIFLFISQASSEQVIKVLKSLRAGKLIEINMYM